MKKKIRLLLLLFCLLVTCSGCTVLSLLGGGLQNYTKEDALLMVKGNLDSMYLDQHDPEYLAFCETTEEEAHQDYEDGIAYEVEYLFSYFEIEPQMISMEQYERAVQLYHKIYDRIKYEIGECIRAEDRFLVSVTVYPIDIIQRAAEKDYDKILDEWENEVDAGILDELTDVQVEQWWAERVLDMLESHIDAIGYLTPVEISVQVVVEESADGSYITIVESDWLRIYEEIISY